MDNCSEPSSTKPSSHEADYPLQRHAGKVGYGPNFYADAGVIDKVEGLTEEIVGKVTHNQKLVHKGHELHTGELKRRELLGETDPAKDPFFGEDHENKQHTKKSSI